MKSKFSRQFYKKAIVGFNKTISVEHCQKLILPDWEKYCCGQIKLGSNFFYCKSELNIKSPEKSSPRG
jgi:hypothetical protein